MHESFAEFAALLLVSALVGAVFARLRQPVLIAYILVGILAGPAGFGLVTAHAQLDLLAQIGVAVLLFAVGLKLDLYHIRHIGSVALATGLGQLAFTILIGFAIVLALDRGWVEALYVAVALTFSSTIIIVKLLSDKRELDTLHGRIAVGFLIVQDLAVVVAMMLMSALGAGGGQQGPAEVLLSLAVRLGAAAVLLFVLMRWVLPMAVAAMARSQELLMIFAVAWGVALAALGEWAGFSKEAGALLAGFSLASTPYREAMHARLSAIRDFLLLFFFIELGARLDLSTLGAEMGAALVLSLFVLVGNPLIVMAIMGFMGYRKRTSLLAGLTVAQISEFSIIFVAMGISLGHVDVSALGLTTLVGLITITLSSYMILYSQPLYERLSPWLGLFERRVPFREIEPSSTPAGEGGVEAVVFGIGRYGGRLLQQLRAADINAVGVDFDPEAVRALRSEGLPVHFGDCEDPEFLASLPLQQAQWVVSTLPVGASTLGLLHALQAAGYAGRVAVALRNAAQAEELAQAQAELEVRVSRVFSPFNDAADRAAELMAEEMRPTRPG